MPWRTSDSSRALRCPPGYGHRLEHEPQRGVRHPQERLDTSRSITGWTLRDRTGYTYRFPTFTLKAGAKVKVHTGKGTASSTDRYYDLTWYVWNNAGDTAYLKNASGTTVHSCTWSSDKPKTAERHPRQRSGKPGDGTGFADPCPRRWPPPGETGGVEHERPRWESPVEKAIREAQERGEFDDLPGAGKPLKGLGDPDDPMWWLRRYAEREQLDMTGTLPPALQLRKEAAAFPESLADLRTEDGRAPRARGLQPPGAPRPAAPAGPGDAAAARPHRRRRGDGRAVAGAASSLTAAACRPAGDIGRGSTRAPLVAPPAVSRERMPAPGIRPTSPTEQDATGHRRRRGPMSDYPHLLAPLTCGHDAAQPRGDGLDAHRARGPRPRLPELAAYFAERARGGVGLIVTGGYAPNLARLALPFASKLTTRRAGRRHRRVTDAVHDEGGQIALQILHAGPLRATTRSCVAASARKSPITPFTPARAVRPRRRRHDRATSPALRRLAREAGYDGVEIMGSEGYLINQFLAAAHQQPHRRVGRHRPRSGCASRSRSCARAREAVGRGLHRHLPDVDARPGRGRPDLGRGRRAGAPRSRRPGRR